MDKKETFQLFKNSFKNWQANNAPIRGAALTFFIILPLPSLLLMVIGVLARFYGQAHATQVLIQQISALAGPSVAGLFNKLLSSSMSPFSSPWVAVTTVAFSLAGAVGAFEVLRDTMDAIWEVKSPKMRSFARMVRRRIGPFVVVSFLGLIVIAWTGIATFLFGAIKFFSASGILTQIALAITRVLLLFGLSTLLFAITYKLIPDTVVHWRDSILGAVIAGVAFTVTNLIIGTYVETFTVTTIIGAAGSLMIILLWIFILNQIMLFGAEVSKIYATNSPVHSREHLTPTAEKIIKHLEAAGEKIEGATKGSNFKAEKAVEKTENGKAAKLEIEKSALGEKVEEKRQNEEPMEAREEGDGSVEVDVKIKTPPKKRKAED